MIGLLDEHSVPSLRHEIGRLLAVADHADFAVRNVRLAALDLTAGEMRGVRKCRLLIGRLEATELVDLGHGSGARNSAARAPANLESLLEFLESGRIEIRSASLGAWTPDFSIFDLPGSESVCLFGAHYFHDPPAALGPSFTAVLRDPLAVHAAAVRFSELWSRSHDVMQPVRHALLRSLGAR